MFDIIKKKGVYMTYTDLILNIRRLSFTNRSRYIPFIIKQFIDEIIAYSKSRELAKRSCDNLIKGLTI